MKIEIINDKIVHCTRHADPDDPWDKDDEATDNNILGFKKSDRYFDIETSFEPERGKDYYLLVVEYQTGDSFQISTGNIEYIDLYDTYEKAHKTFMEIADDINSEEYIIKLTMNNGKSVEICKPWVGYFERLEGVEIVTVRLLD